MKKDWQDVDFEWIPFVGVGVFKFGESIDDYLNKGMVRYVPDEDSDSSESGYYEALDNTLIVYTDRETIDMFSCHEKCIFKGVNLIGLSLTEFAKLLGGVTDHEMDGDKEVFKFQKVSAMIWAKDKIAESIVMFPHGYTFL